MEIENGNRLIAEFMGWKSVLYANLPNRMHRTDEKGVQWADDIRNFKYHSSWDWLMPVVEKIQSLHCNVNIINKYCQIIRFKEGGYGEIEYTRTWTMADTKIENTWQSAISFIQWYNTLSPESTKK